MKRHLVIFLLILFYYGSNGQNKKDTQPKEVVDDIQIINSNININIDTTGSRLFTPDYNLRINGIQIYVINEGSSNFIYESTSTYHIIKPEDTVIISIPFTFKIDEIELSFISGIKKIDKKVYVTYTFGKSDLIEIQNPIWNLTDEVENLVENKSDIYGIPCYEVNKGIHFEKELKINNISGKKIIIPRRANAYWDWGHRIQYYVHDPKFRKEIDSNSFGFINIYLDAAYRKKFNWFGYLIVHTQDCSNYNIVFTKFYSNYVCHK